MTMSRPIRLDDCLTSSLSLSPRCNDPLSQWKTHLNLITWARLLLLSYFLSVKSHFLSYTPSLFSLLFCCPFLVALLFLLSLCSSYWIKVAPHYQSAKTHTQDIQHSSVAKRPLVQRLLDGALLCPPGSAIGQEPVLIS